MRYFLIAVFMIANVCIAQPPGPLWTQTIGGEQSEYLTRLDHAFLGGYVAVGTEVLNVNNDSARIAFLKFDDYGNILWQAQSQPGNVSYGSQIQRTWDNSTYIIAGTSRTTPSTTLSTSHLIRIDGQGNVLWTGSYNQEQMGMEAKVACAYTGDFILLGNISIPSQGYRIHLNKVNANGMEIWSKTIGDYYSSGCAIVPGFDDGFYIAGTRFSFANMSNDCYLLKTDANGDTIWTATTGTTDYESLVDLKKTSDAKLIAVGNRWIQGDNQIMLIKYDLDGNVIWTRYIGAYENFYPGSVIQDTDGGYLISGSTYTSVGSIPILVKTNTNGYVRWIANAGNGSTGYLSDAVPCYYPGGYMAVGGNNVQSIFNNMYLVKMESDPLAPVSVVPFASNDITLPFTGGQFDFTLTVTNESSYTQIFDIWAVIELPNIGEVPVLTSLNKSLTGLGSISKTLTQYVPASAPEGVYTYNVYIGTYPWQIYYYDSFSFIKTGGSGNDNLNRSGWYLSGWSDESNNPSLTLPDTERLSNYPNPFNPTTAINYQLSVASNVTLSVYDINGRQVAILVNGWREPGSHFVSFDGSGLSSGIYIYRLEANNHTASGKMMLVK